MNNRRCYPVAWAFLASFSVATIWQTQTIVALQVVFRGNGGVDQGKQLNAALDREFRKIKFMQEKRMSNRIDDMNRICELSDEQVTKLTIAAKGAIEKSLEKIRDQYITLLGQRGMLDNLDDEESDDEGGEPADAADDGDMDENVTDDEFDEAEWQLAGGIDLGFVRRHLERNGVLAEPESEIVWQVAVEKTLTEHQAATYAEMVAKRAALRRKAAVDAFIARVEVELLLRDSQREELTRLVDEKYGRVLQKDLVRLSQQVGFQNASSSRSKIDTGARKILSDNQYQIWKSTFANELEQIAMRNGGGNVDEDNGGLLQLIFGK